MTFTYVCVSCREEIRLKNRPAGKSGMCMRCMNRVKSKVSAEVLRTHGMKGTSIYNTWSGLVQRCTNERDTAYPRYGGRGIKVCARWLKFDNFYADMGDRPADATLDRINNDGNYEPGNCRWATRQEQARNRRTGIYVMLNGQRMDLKQAAALVGVPYSAAIHRHKRGFHWAVPVRSYGAKPKFTVKP